MKRFPVDGKSFGEHDGNMTLLVPSCINVRKALRFHHEFRFHCTSHFDSVTFTRRSLISHLLILLSHRKKKSIINNELCKEAAVLLFYRSDVSQTACSASCCFLHLNEPLGTFCLSFLNLCLCMFMWMLFLF